MSLLFVRYFFISLCSSYLYFKILNIELEKAKHMSILFLNSCLVSIVTFSLSNNEAPSRIISMVVLSFIILSAFLKISFSKSQFTIIISYGLSYVLLYLSILVICFIYILIFQDKDSIPYNYAHIPVGFFQFFLTVNLSKSHRLRNGFISLIKHNNIFHGITL